VVLGSRYLHGRVTVVNWPIAPTLLSYFANVYARWVTGLPLADATGGFKCFRREVLQAIALDRVESNGYAFQIEMSFRAWKKGFRLGEIPIMFVDRDIGESKMSKKIVREAVWRVWRLSRRWLSPSRGKLSRRHVSHTDVGLHNADYTYSRKGAGERGNAARGVCTMDFSLRTETQATTLTPDARERHGSFEASS
jgi:GT2 family glycosyltransferase